MNDEDAWQAHFDQNPEDHFARQAFADWLDDRDDPRAAGYRAMGRLEFFAHRMLMRSWWVYAAGAYGKYHFANSNAFLPDSWFDALIRMRVESGHRGTKDRSRCHELEESRRESEDIIALAWAKLTPEQQAEILSRVEVAA